MGLEKGCSVDVLDIRERLKSMAEEEYRVFSSRLLPGKKNILGVRLPALRSLAKTMARGDWQTYILWNEKKYFEEYMLHGMILGYAKMDFDTLLVYITQLLPCIDNWSVCDSFCAGLKAFEKNLALGFEFLRPLAGSKKEYEARFAFVMYLDHYKSSPYIHEILKAATQLKAKEYYARMSVAWMLSKYYVNYLEEVTALLEDSLLDEFTHNMTISKICDSTVVSREDKAIVKRLRRQSL